MQVRRQVPGLQEHSGLLGARVLQLEHVVARILLHRLPDLLRLRPAPQSRLRRAAAESPGRWHITALSQTLRRSHSLAHHRPCRSAPTAAHGLMHSTRSAVWRQAQMPGSTLPLAHAGCPLACEGMQPQGKPK